MKDKINSGNNNYRNLYGWKNDFNQFRISIYNSIYIFYLLNLIMKFIFTNLEILFGINEFNSYYYNI